MNQGKLEQKGVGMIRVKEGSEGDVTVVPILLDDMQIEADGNIDTGAEVSVMDYHFLLPFPKWRERLQPVRDYEIVAVGGSKVSIKGQLSMQVTRDNFSHEICFTVCEGVSVPLLIRKHDMQRLGVVLAEVKKDENGDQILATLGNGPITESKDETEEESRTGVWV